MCCGYLVVLFRRAAAGHLEFRGCARCVKLHSTLGKEERGKRKSTRFREAFRETRNEKHGRSKGQDKGLTSRTAGACGKAAQGKVALPAGGFYCMQGNLVTCRNIGCLLDCVSRNVPFRMQSVPTDTSTTAFLLHRLFYYRFKPLVALCHSVSRLGNGPSVEATEEAMEEA